MPATSWHISLENRGGAAARYPIVELEFHDAFFAEDDFPEWSAVHHAHAFGWYGFQWSPGSAQIVAPGFTIQLPAMDFKGKYIIPERFDSPCRIDLQTTVAADGFPRRTYSLPMKID